MALTLDIIRNVDASLAQMLEEFTERNDAEMLLLTPRGSRLYGLENQSSDYDYFAVTTKVKNKRAKFAKQYIANEYDLVIMDLGTFINYCASGIPENLEAMFSRQAVYDEIGALRSQYRAGTQTWDRYLRTIKSFAMESDFKHKRHALRLAINFSELSCTGRFDPMLTPAEIETINKIASVGSPAFVYDYALDIAWEGVLR